MFSGLSLRLGSVRRAGKGLAATIKAILNISGNLGLIHDENGGDLANARSSTATFINQEGRVENVKPNEIRFHKGRRVENLFPDDSEAAWGSNQHLSPVEQVITLNDAPFYIQSGIVHPTGSTNKIQRNWNISDNDGTYNYHFSFIVKAGPTTTTVRCTNIGLFGYDMSNVEYTFATDSELNGWRIEHLKNGYIRLSKVFNHPLATLFVFNIASGPDMDGLISTGMSIVKTLRKIPIAYEYVSTSPGRLQNTGIVGTKSLDDVPVPAGYLSVNLWGDSQIGQTNHVKYKLPRYITAKFGQSINNGVGGESSSEIRTRFEASGIYSDEVQFIWVGQNNFTDPTQVIADIDAMVSLIPHSDFIIVSVHGFATQLKGSDGYNDVKQINDHIAVTYPNNYVDTRSYLISMYDPNIPQDVIDFNNDVVPATFRVDVVHLDDAGVQLTSPLLWLKINKLEGVRVTKLDPVPTIMHEPEGTNEAFPASTPATQIIALSADDYTVWLDDTDDLGQIVLTGGATGTARSTDTNGFQFAADGNAVTFTHSGSNNVHWQVESGDYRTSFIDTTAAPVTRAADDISIPLAVGTNFNQDEFIVIAKIKFRHDESVSGNKSLVSLSESKTNLLYTSSSGFRTYDGSTILGSGISEFSADDSVIVSIIGSSVGAYFSIAHSLDGGVTFSTWQSASYDEGFSTASDFNLFKDNLYTNYLESLLVYGELVGDKSEAPNQAWVEGNAQTLTEPSEGTTTPPEQSTFSTGFWNDALVWLDSTNWKD